MKLLKLTSILSGIFLGSFMLAQAATVFYGNQLGNSATSGYVLQSTGANSTSNWVATSTLGISGGSGGSGTISTSSPLVSGQSVYATGVNTIASAANMLWNNATSLLTITGNASTTQLTTTGNTYLATLGGNVGIGTASPGYPLDINGTAQVTNGNLVLMDTTNSVRSFIIYRNSVAIGDFDTNNAQFTIRAASGKRIDFQANGNSIGSHLTIDTTGYVGIGNTAPATSLDITNRNATSTPAFTLRDSTGAIGLQISAGTSTLANVFIGQSAGVSNTTGFNNSFTGYQAGNNNTTGFNNSFIGYQAGFHNTTGSNNSFTGNSAGDSNTTGSNNSFTGYWAGGSNTTGSYNSFTGYQAGNSNTTGSGNSFTGNSAGYSNTTGSYNSFTGYQAGYFNTTGSNNSFTGYNVGVFNTTGSYNTGLGYQALYNANGYDNIMLGHVQNFGGNNITTGYNNIALGYNAGIGTSTNSTNFLNIGNSFFGSMIATTTSTSLPTSFKNASFAIATSSLLANTTFAVQNSSSANTVANFFSNAGSSLLTIQNSGNVGIGSTTPWAQLSINSNGITGPAFTIGSSTATNFIVTNGGNVGIGTTNPSSALQLGGNGGINGSFDVQSNTGSSWFSVVSGVVSFNSSGGSTRAGGIDLGARFNIQPVNDTFPALAVRGVVAGVSDLVRVSSPAVTTGDLFIIKSTGMIGIGTTTPSALLSLAGTSGLFASTTATSTFQGGGINLITGAGNTGCFAVNGVCVGGGGNGTVTSVGLSSSGSLTIGSTPITTSGTITANLNMGNANTWTALQSFANASSTQFSSGTNTFYVDSTGHTTAKDTVNGWSGVVSPTHSFVLSTATTTAWTASTTGSAYSPYLIMPFAGTLRQMRCSSDSFLGVNTQVNGSDATPSYVVASSTVGVVQFTAGNTFTVGQKILANFGTTTTATAKGVSCTYDVTETP